MGGRALSGSFPVATEVALAMLQREGRWLMQLRDDIPGIISPGCWGLFGGHLDPGETPEQALRRELIEEIGWQPLQLRFLRLHHHPRRLAHVFHGELSIPLEQLQLLEGQGMDLIEPRELLSGSIWSHQLGAHRPLVDGLPDLIQQLLGPQV